MLKHHRADSLADRAHKISGFMLIHHSADMRRIGDFYFFIFFLDVLRGTKFQFCMKKTIEKKCEKIIAMFSVNFARLATKG